MARTLVTSALPYANGPIHLGHLAGAYLPADLYVRYLRLKGEDVVYVCGSDEMGVAIMMRAHQEGVSPREIIDRYHPIIEQGLRAAGISFDHYGRTSAPIHAETAQSIFRGLAKKGVFRLKAEQQLFDPVAGVFLADRFVRGTCPVCGYEEAYGDQCEKCGTSLSPSELLNPRSVLSDATPEWRETTHWYLPLGQMQPDLEAWLATHPDWKPNVTGQVRSWLTDGLKDRAITRDISWGIPVPEEVAKEAGVDVSGKVLYVWFDAPIGYISSTREWAALRGTPDAWKPYWQDPETKLIHFIGKDNIVFHCLIFPGMLMMHGDFILPAQVPANEFLNLEGQKFSTSRNWAIWLHEFLERFDADQVRYALGASLPETKDADFSLSEFQSRVNGELADVLGNFVHRALTFTHRQFEGKVPAKGTLSADGEAVLQALETAPQRIGELYERFRFRDALFETMALARMGNKFFNDAAPWHQIKTDRAAAESTLYVALQVVASLSVLFEPVIPHASAKLRGMLGLVAVRPSVPADTPSGLGWSDAKPGLLPEGHVLGLPEVLFTKIEDERIEAERARLGAPAVEAAPEPALPYAQAAEDIPFDDFARIDLRAGRILAADAVPKTDKLLRLDVDLGFETRQIVSGIAQHFAPETLVGKQVVVVANLAPRKLRGLVSQGMLLTAEDRDGTLRLVETHGEPGALVK